MDWLTPDMPRKYGGSLASAAPVASKDTMSTLPNAAGHSPREAKAPLAPGSALFWVMALVAVSVGAAGYSTAVRVGPVKASLSAGK